MRKLFVSALALLSVSAVYAEGATTVVNPAVNGGEKFVSEKSAGIANDDQSENTGKEKTGNNGIRGSHEQSVTPDSMLNPQTNHLTPENSSGTARKPLEVEKVNANDILKNPAVFASLLRAGYWLDAPHASTDGWTGSILVTKETLNCLKNKNGQKLADLLISDNAKPGLKDGAVIFISQALTGLPEADLRVTIDRLLISEQYTYEDVLSKRGLMERYKSTIEATGKRPPVGIVLNFSDGLKIGLAETENQYKNRFAMAREIEKLENQLDEKIQERNKFISPEEQAALQEVLKLDKEKAELEKQIVEEKAKHADEIAKAEADKKAAESALASLNTQTKSSSSRRNRTTKRDTAAQTNAKNENQAKLKAAEDKLKALSATTAGLERQRDSIDAQIKKLEQNDDLAASRVLDKRYDKEISAILEKIKECYMRLQYLDPEQISIAALKEMKLSKEIKAEVAELDSLKSKNIEIQNILDANKDAAEKAENAKKALDAAKAELATAQKMPTKSGRGASAKKAAAARQKAITSAQEKVNSAQKTYDEAMKQLPENYWKLKEEFEANNVKIRELSSEDVLAAKKIIETANFEKRAGQVN